MASKKSRRQPPAKNNPTDLTEEAFEHALTDFRSNEVAENTPQPQPKQLSLAEIRAAVLRAHTHTAHTIADLEAWRDEIEATLAFLRARGR
jgi:hypothetical protein